MFVVSDEEDIDGMQDAGVALVRAYNYISDEVDSQSAFEALISVSLSTRRLRAMQAEHFEDGIYRGDGW